MIEAIIFGLLGVFFTLSALYLYWEYRRITQKHIIIDDPTDDPEYLEIVRRLHCPDCGSTDFRYTEVTELPWIQGEDRYCICNRCGKPFGDGK